MSDSWVRDYDSKLAREDAEEREDTIFLNHKFKTDNLSIVEMLNQPSYIARAAADYIEQLESDLLEHTEDFGRCACCKRVQHNDALAYPIRGFSSLDILVCDDCRK